MPKFILVTGGVISGVGKGVIVSSVGAILKTCGMRVIPIKIDPYLNVNAENLSPFEHGEVYVLNDGSQVDLDLGNYERFMDLELTEANSITTGKVYSAVMKKERQGGYLGKTIQIVPHITDHIKESIAAAANGCDVCIIELGGTCGDIESAPFLEAFKQLKVVLGRDLFHIHVSLVPFFGEHKTKPVQLGVRNLMNYCLPPDLLVCRSQEPVGDSVRAKLGLFSMLPLERIFSIPNYNTVYKVPFELVNRGILGALGFGSGSSKLVCNLNPLVPLVTGAENGFETRVRVGIFGKYTQGTDSYLSLCQAIEHACFSHGVGAEIVMCDNALQVYNVDAIIVPGGFGERASDFKLECIRLARQHSKPFLGICLGFQLAVIEFARSIVAIHSAGTNEFDPMCTPVVSSVGEFVLGSRDTVLDPKSRVCALYEGAGVVSERHRHRYGVNIEYLQSLENSGMVFSGKCAASGRPTVLELPSHPYFVATQYHPEFKTRPLRCHPLFGGLIKAVICPAPLQGI